MPRSLLAFIAAIVAGGGATTATPAPTVAIWSPPPDWVTVSSADGGIQLTLPPTLDMFDKCGAIFASE